MRVMAWIVVVLIAFIFILWLGFQVSPRAFGAPPVQAGAVETVPLPAGLPAPVDRFYRTVYGDNVPFYTSVVMTGHARIRPAGPWHLPARTRFIHEVGESYRHYIEITWFGVPVMAVDEGYVDGASFFANALLGKEENEPKSNQGANLALWAEAVSFPSLLVTDPRVRWEPIDDHSALLRVPFGEETQTLVVRFDAATGLINYMEAMRYQGSAADAMTLWVPIVLKWGANGNLFEGMDSSVLWVNQPGPWAYFTMDEIIHNGDVSTYIRARGE